VLDIDAEKERVSLGIKQLSGDPLEKVGPLKKGSIVTGTVSEVNDGGVEVSLADGVKAFIRRSDLARDRADQRPDRFGVGEKIDAMVTSIDKASRKISLSIKAREVSEEKEAVKQFGSTDSGASLGDILGAALKRRGTKADDDGDEDKDGE
jgi:small subunit ribosomal protein S1